jgi:hypothetical protein
MILEGEQHRIKTDFLIISFFKIILYIGQSCAPLALFNRQPFVASRGWGKKDSIL